MVCSSPVRSVLARTGGMGCSVGAGFGFDAAGDWPRAEAATVLAVRERKERRCMGGSGVRVVAWPGWMRKCSRSFILVSPPPDGLCKVFKSKDISPVLWFCLRLNAKARLFGRACLISL